MGKVFKRGKVWHAWVKSRSGAWSRKSTNCTDRRAAELFAAELERDAADPGHAAKASATTQRVLDEYLLSRTRLGRRPGTIHHVRTKAGALLGLLPTYAAEISHAGMSKYVDTRLDEGARRTTIKKELRVLKAALRLATKNALWDGDPAAVIPELEDDYEPRERTLAPWELVGLAQVLPAKRMALVAFATATGCDFSAIFRARRIDVTADMASVHVRGTKRRARDRVVPVPLPEQRAMLSWAMARAGEDVLFTPWANMVRDLAAACAKLGIPRCSANDLRRTYGTWLRNAGVEPQLIAPAMGHIDGRMTERVYGRLGSLELAKLVDSRVAMLLPAPQKHSTLIARPRIGASPMSAKSYAESVKRSIGLKIPVSAVRFRPCAPQNSADIEGTAVSGSLSDRQDRPESTGSQRTGSTADPAVLVWALGLLELARRAA
jgi:integrase